MAETATPVKRAKNPSSTFVMILAFVGVFLIMFNEGLRTALGTAVGLVFNPTIGFPSAPIWTIFLGGVVMIVATSVIRHYLVDWMKMARTQDVMRTYQKELSEARKANNTYKMKRLTEMQGDMLQMQAEMSTDQMKPMAFTMLLVIPIFAWLLHFVAEIATTDIIRMPWATEWDLLGNWWFLPHWILLYSLFSIPFGSLTQKALKMWEYSRLDVDKDGKPMGKAN